MFVREARERINRPKPDCELRLIEVRYCGPISSSLRRAGSRKHRVHSPSATAQKNPQPNTKTNTSETRRRKKRTPTNTLRRAMKHHLSAKRTSCLRSTLFFLSFLDTEQSRHATLFRCGWKSSPPEQKTSRRALSAEERPEKNKKNKRPYHHPLGASVLFARTQKSSP